METNSDGAGTLDDVDVAVRAARRAVRPWWDIVAYSVLVALTYTAVAALVVTGLSVGYALAIVAVAALVMVGRKLMERRRGARADDPAHGSAAWVTLMAGVLVVSGGMPFVIKIVDPRSCGGYAVVFVAALVLHGGTMAISEWFAGRRPA